MQRVDRVLAVLLIVLGCVHNFIAAPMIYPELTVRALWFISAGLALWYAGFINLLRTRSPGQHDRLLAWLCVLTNISMLVHALAYASVAGIWTEASSIALILGIGVLTCTAILQLVRLRKGAGSADARSAV